MFCENRKLTDKKPPSNIPTSFSFSEEIFKDNTITYIRNLFYNEQYKLVRYDTREGLEDVFNSVPLTIINDYNIGVSYRINKNTDLCTISSIETSAIELDANYTQSLLDSADGNFAIRLRSAKSLLQLDSDYIFTGRRYINGIDSNVFITKVTVGKTKLVNEYAFPVVRLKFKVQN